MDGPEGGGRRVTDLPEEGHFSLEEVAEEGDGEVVEGAGGEAEGGDGARGEVGEEGEDDFVGKEGEGIVQGDLNVSV